MTVTGLLEWGLMTIRDKLNFGMGEAEGIKRREMRVKGVLISAIKGVKILEAEHALMKEALEKIADPRKRHKEPDKYTELGCVMNIADVALQGVKNDYSITEDDVNDAV
jgi:hypothetical protein